MHVYYVLGLFWSHIESDAGKTPHIYRCRMPAAQKVHMSKSSDLEWQSRTKDSINIVYFWYLSP